MSRLLRVGLLCVPRILDIYVRFCDHWILCANLLLWVTFLGCLGGLHCGIPDLKWDTVIVGYHHVNILLWVSYAGYLISSQMRDTVNLGYWV